MKRLLLTLLLVTSYISMAQTDLNDYKYIIVPKKFDAFKRENQYQTSTFTKHLFAKNGFNAVYEDELPMELYKDRCLGLLVELQDDSSMFTTKVSLVLKDCRSQEVFTTIQGKSRLKEYTASYNEAIKGAFTSLDNLDYRYSGASTKSEPVTVSFKNDVKILEENTKTTSELNANQDPMVQQKATLEEQSYKDLRPVESNITKKIESGQETIQQVATKEEQSYENRQPISSNISKADMNSTKRISDANEAKDIWYAQELTNGYQLVDSTPKIRMKLFESSVQGVYHAKMDNKNGMVYTKNGKWFFEYYQGGNLMTKELNIKF
ncbi:hypothetical protein [Ulvibacterium marinum]|uniref:hypothetical protein n=1 Tax=Ulvibacterium marinum TaxID=2419782 RepID=UPI0024942965|nr:hypothetical protein [Ulvibacterium marinum]